MADAITDQQIVKVLRPFVRATRPLLDGLREADAFGLRSRVRGEDTDELERRLRDKILDRLADAQAPGTAAWAEMDPHRRSYWWIRRVGNFVALIAAVPGVGGALADRLPIGDALGTAAQGLVLCAIAGEYRVTGEDERVRMLAEVLFGRRIEPGVLAARSDADSVAADATSAELTEELDTAQRTHGRATLRALAGTVWRLGRTLWSLGDELEKRPRGRLPHRLLGKLPVLGVLGGFLGERSGLRRAAYAGLQWIAAHPPAGGSLPAAGAR